MDPQQLRAVAAKIVRECAGIKPGENIYIEGRVDSIDYLEMVALECELVGARPMVVAVSDEHRRERLLRLSTGQLSSMSKCWVEAVKAADMVFTIRLEDGKPELFRDIPDGKFGASLEGRKHLADWIYDGTRRWIGTDLPTPEQARAFNLDWDDYSAMFWRAMDVDYGALKARAEAVAAVLRGAGEVHITSPAGTDVTMRIDGRPLDLDVGVVTDEAKLSNLPAGEVCLAPLEDQAEGTVVFDLAFWNGVRIEELVTRFERGVCHPVSAKTGFETFAGVLASAGVAANVIAELGIGLNPAVGEPCGYMLTDEKILGTIHIAVGDNRMLGGVNDSSLHWDLLVMHPTVTADGVVLLDRGDLQV